MIFQNFFSRHAHFLLHAPEPPHCTPSNIRTQLLEDNEVPVRDQVWSCMLARVPSLKRMCWQTGSLSNFLSFFLLLLLLRLSVQIPQVRQRWKSDNDAGLVVEIDLSDATGTGSLRLGVEGAPTRFLKDPIIMIRGNATPVEALSIQTVLSKCLGSSEKQWRQHFSLAADLGVNTCHTYAFMPAHQV